jgi:hypothetical protein
MNVPLGVMGSSRAEFPYLPGTSGIAEVYPSKGGMDGSTGRTADRYTPPLPWERTSAALASTAPRIPSGC